MPHTVIVYYRHAPAMPSSVERWVELISISGRKTEQYRSDERQQSALTDLVRAVEHHQRPLEEADLTVEERPEAIDV